MRKVILFFSVIISCCAFAQTGELSGIILDDEISGEGLPFADVYIEGTTKGTNTDMEGKFTISGIEPGVYTVGISFVGYETKKISGVTIVAGQLTKISETLGLSAATLDVVEVVANTSVKESEKALLTAQKKADVIVEAIGSQELSRKGVSDAAAAVTKLAGVTRSSVKSEIYIRGLGDRYVNTTLNGLPLPSNDIEKKNIDLDLFSSDIIQNISVSKSYTPSFYGDFGSGNVNIKSKEHSGDDFFSLEIGSNANTVSVTEQTLRNQGTGFAGFYRRHAINPFNVSVLDLVDPVNAESNIGVSGKLSFGKKISFDNGSRLSLFGSASFDSRYDLREGSAVDFTIVERQAFESATEYEYNRTTTLIGSAVFKINPDNKLKYTSLYINDATDEIGYYGLDGNGRNREARIDTDKGFFVSNSQFDQNTIVVNQLLGENDINDKLSLDWGIGYNKVLARQPDRKRFVFEQYDLLLDNDPTTNATFFNNTRFDNQRYFQDIIDDEWNARVELSYELNGNVSFDLGYNFRTKERDFSNIRYGYDFATDRIQSSSVTNLNGIINADNFNQGIYEIAVFNGLDPLAPTRNTPGLPENTYTGELNIHAAYLNTKIKVGEKLSLVPALRIEDFSQEIVYDAINLDPRDPRFQQANEIFFLPSLNVKYSAFDNANVRLSGSRTVSNPEFKEVAPYIYEDVTTRVGGNPDLLGETAFSDIYNIDAKFEYFPSSGELLSLAVYGKQINDPVNKVITSDATGVQRFFRTGDKAEVIGLEIEARKNLISVDDKSILTGGLNISLTKTEQDLKTVNAQSPGGFNTSFSDKTSDELQGASPWIINADLTYKPKLGDYKPQITLVYSQSSDRIDALGGGKLGNIVEKSVPFLDLVLKSSFTENLSMSLAVKNILNQNLDFIREDTPQGDVLISRYKQGLDIGINFKYNF